MFRMRNASLAIALVTPWLSLSAQSGAAPGAVAPANEIRGRIVDTANAPLPNASVSLRVKGSTATVAGALVNRNGAFRVTGLKPGTYSIRAVAIGYSPVIQDITLTAEKPVLDLGTAKLAPLIAKLNDLTVKEEKAVVTAEPDRNVYTAKSVAPGAANASDILENVPSVSVDQDGKVSLRGNENVVIQVNGRPTPMTGTQLAAYLKSLSANVIDRIEVIPNPSARYDPEGMAGIINIALKQNVDLGLSGTVNSAVSDAARYNHSLNVGYQAGRWTTFASAGLVGDERSAVGLTDRDRYSASTLTSVSDQAVTLAPSNKGQSLNVTVDYKLGRRDVLSNALMLNHRSSGEASLTSALLLDGSGSTLDQYSRPRQANTHGVMFDYDVSLKRTYAPRTHELSAELRLTRSHDQDSADDRRRSGNGYVDGKIDQNDAVTKQFAGQLDYVRTLHPRTKLETGWKTTARWLDRDYLNTVDPTGSGTWSPSALSNSFSFDESVHAVYAVLNQGAGKWDLQAGLRGEVARRTFAIATSAYPYNYNSLFPSAVAAYNVSKETQIKASYSRRIRRPGTQELNPFPNFFDADNVFIGNPKLNPEYTDSYDFSWTRTGSWGMLQVSPFYRYTSDVIRIKINTADTLNGRPVTSVSFQNLEKSNSWGSDLTSQLKLSRRLSVLTNATLFRLVTDGGSINSVGSDALGWMARINLNADVTRSLGVQAGYNYRSSMKIERGEIAEQQMMNISFRKKIQGDKGVLMLRIADPFQLMKFHIRTGDDNLMQITERTPNMRAVFLGYQYNFGHPPRVRQVAPDQTSGGSVGFGG